MPPIITPEQLVDKINALIPDCATGDRVFVMELSTQVVRCVILKMTAFCNFRRETEYPLPTAAREISDRVGSTRRDHMVVLLQRVIYQMPENIIAGFVVGDLAGDHHLIEGLERFFRVGVVSLNDNGQPVSLPPKDQIKQILERSFCQALHALNLVVAGVNDYDHTIEQDRIKLYESTPPGDRLDPRTPMATIQLVPPVLNEALVLMFEEVPIGYDYPNRGVYYWIIAHKSPFTVTIKFDPNTGGWVLVLKPDEAKIAPRDENLNWTGERSEYDVGTSLPMPDELEFSEGLPNIVFAVESTLGMHRAYELSNGRPPDSKSTDFAVVQTFCEKIIQSLYYISDLRYMLLFYGSHQSKPSEFLDSPIRSANPVITHLPGIDSNPDFVTADELLNEINQNFMQMQTASKTWHKSVDEAVHFLNHSTPWNHSDRVVIWIAQSPPFEYGGNDAVPIESIGYLGKYSLREELAKLTDPGKTNVKNLVFLITGDTPRRLLPLSKRGWLPVVGGDQKRIFEMTAADESDAQITDSADFAIRSIAEYNRRRIIRNLSNTPLQLPFVYDSYNPLTYLEG